MEIEICNDKHEKEDLSNIIYHFMLYMYDCKPIFCDESSLKEIIDNWLDELCEAEQP